ncbi:type IV pilus biogenesis complex ATPase subunit [Haloferax volcanii DSM 14919]|uniref:Type IV pilus biogenesis complex ATPase subunit n=1 Tax=Haloferax lucentense (strain DSM 14919 / JCM 9276 / NCIMB 13854 / Aa 2.2) TaxID=1230452 RepID=M0GVD5_HALL2|nr:type II/IV secretion system ATPase subunit [Haloferax lucentense]ELZ76201.1 type IV pilus biogenesis complex ATPase subunit [Haloferax lucentense DSM 14919]
MASPDKNSQTDRLDGEESFRADGAGTAELVPTTGPEAMAARASELPVPTSDRIEYGPVEDLAVDEAADEDRPETLREAVLSEVKAFFAEVDETAFAPAPSEAFIEDQFFDFSFLEGVETVEHYWVNKPFAFVSILYDHEKREHRYHVSEPRLDDFEDFVRDDLTKILRNSLLYRDLDADGDREDVFDDEAREIITEHAATVEDGSLWKLFYFLLRDFIHFGRIDPVMRDPGIEDISCDGDDVPVYVFHSVYRDVPTNVVFDDGDLSSFTIRLAQRAGKQVTVSDPLVDASLPDGSRVQLTLGSDVATRGSNFTIRKFSDVPLSPVDLVRWNTFSVEQMAYFWLAIENNRSLIFAGGTGSGKTTSMNAVSFFVPGHAKVVSIEDTREITLPHDNWIQSVTRDTFTADGRGEVSMYALLQAALRQRPEYLLVGEIRTEERVALTFFHSIATGHTAYTTFHADSSEGVVHRMRNEPLGVPAQMLSDLDIISVQKQIHLDGDRTRRNIAVTEIAGVHDDGEVELRDVFKRNPENDAHERVGDSVVLDEIAAERGWTKADLKYELDVRADVLRYIAASGVDDYLTVSAVIRRFERDREGLLAHVYAETSLVSVDENGEADESDDPAAGENDAAADDFDDEIEVSPETERLLADLFDIELDDDADGDSDDDADDDEVADAAEAEAAPAADESEAATPDAADESDDPDDVGTDWEVVGDDADAGADDAEADSAVVADAVEFDEIAAAGPAPADDASDASDAADASDASDASPDDPDDADETVTDDDREADDAR